MKQYCSECGGELFHDINTGEYVCKKCGLVFYEHDLLDKPYENTDDTPVSYKKEYLKWWLSSKDNNK